MLATSIRPFTGPGDGARGDPPCGGVSFSVRRRDPSLARGAERRGERPEATIRQPPYPQPVDSERGSIAALIAAAAFVVVALALLWGAGEAHFRGCVAETSARYPPIAVSAFSRQETGPLKVAYD